MSYLQTQQITRPIPNSPYRTITLPSEFDYLRPCDLGGFLHPFAKGFIGSIEAYHTDRGVIIVRQLYGASSTLHSSESCLRVLGFKINKHTFERDESDRVWTAFNAQNAKNKIHVRSIVVKADQKDSWSSEKSWYCSAVFRSQKTRYLAITEISDAISPNTFF